MRPVDFKEPVEVEPGTVVCYSKHRALKPEYVPHCKDWQTLQAYDDVFERWGRVPERVLEIGVHAGGSLLVWHKLWPEATVKGVDVTLRPLHPAFLKYAKERPIRVVLLAMPTANVHELGELDLVVDDGEHGADSVLANFALCWPMLRPGGLYILEDWHLPVFAPVQTAGMLACSVIGTDTGEHFCDGPFPPDSALRFEAHRRLLAIFKR